MVSIMLKYLLPLAILVMPRTNWGQLATFSFDGSSGNEINLPPDQKPENGTLSDITRGSGVNPTSSAGEFSASNWSIGDLDDNDYFTFTVSANESFELTLLSIVFDERRSGTGIRNISVRSSLDNFNSDLLLVEVPDNSSVRNQTVNLDATFANLSDNINLEFRIYGYRAERTSGTWWLDNIQLFGTIAPPDIDPPGIQSAEVINQNKISVQFDEGITLLSAENIANYTLNDSLNPVSARRTEDITLVELEFALPFENGANNTLKAMNISDLAGNSQIMTSAVFIFYLISQPAFRDIVINEIMADPTPAINLPEAEYVELVNISEANFDLNGFTLNDDLITDTEYLLLPGSHVILTDDSNADQFSLPTIGMNSMGALTNTGEQLLLRDETNNTVVDIVTYDNAWYEDGKEGGGYSLERIGDENGCGPDFNWTSSQAVDGGTPGSVNSVNGIPAEIPIPEVVTYTLKDGNSLQIELSRLPANDPSTSNISSKQLPLKSITVDETTNSLIIDFSQAFVPGIFYKITVNDLLNCDNSLVEPFDIKFGMGAPPKYNELIISEIMAKPIEDASLPNIEYIELYNPTDKVISLENVGLSDATSETFLPSYLIRPQQFIIVTANRGKESFASFGEVISVANWPSLNNLSDIITLSKGDLIIASVAYDDSWYKDDEKSLGGWSLEMVDVNNPCGRDQNWTSSIDEVGGTPGSMNSVAEPNPDNMGPMIESAYAYKNKITVHFNEKLNPDISTLKTELKPILSVGDYYLTRPADDIIEFEAVQEIEPKIIYEISITGLSDCLGNLIREEQSKVNFVLPEPASISDIVINEILFNPKQGGVDFVEVLNRSDKFINLKNWYLDNQSLDSAVSPIKITSDNLILEPGQLLAFTEDPVILKGRLST